MTKRIIITSLLAGGVLLLGSAAMAGQPNPPVCECNVDVCHRSPGNPANLDIISVAPSAVPAHLAHGDNVVEPEVCGDGIDNDCDGVVDDGCPTFLQCLCSGHSGNPEHANACLSGAVDCSSSAAATACRDLGAISGLTGCNVVSCQTADCMVP